MNEKPTFEIYIGPNGRAYRRATREYREAYKRKQKLTTVEVALPEGKIGTVLVRKEWNTTNK